MADQEFPRAECQSQREALTYYYRPQRSCGQGNVFTAVCDSVHRGGVCLSACWDTLLTKETPQEGGTPPKKEAPLKKEAPPPEGDPTQE